MNFIKYVLERRSAHAVEGGWGACPGTFQTVSEIILIIRSKTAKNQKSANHNSILIYFIQSSKIYHLVGNKISKYMYVE